KSLKSAPQRSIPEASLQPRKQFVKERQQRSQPSSQKLIRKKNGEVKQIHEMTPEELRERSKNVRSAPKGIPAQQPLPMPDGETAWGGGAQAGNARGGQNIAGLLARALGATGIEDVGGGE